MRVRVPILSETWERVEKLAAEMPRLVRAVRKAGSAMTEDDRAVARSFREPDDGMGYTICRQLYRSEMVRRIEELATDIVTGVGLNWSGVLTLAAEAAPPAKLPPGQRRMVDASLDEAVVRKAHDEASRLMGRAAVSWEEYLRTTAANAPKVGEYARQALLEGESLYRAWREKLEAWDGVDAPPAWPEKLSLTAPPALQRIDGRWTAERVLGAWLDEWAANFVLPSPRAAADSLTVLVDGEVVAWRSLYYRGVAGRKLAQLPWTVEQEAWIRGKIRDERKRLLL